VDVSYPYRKALSLTYEADEVSIVILRSLIEQGGIQIKGASYTSCLFIKAIKYMQQAYPKNFLFFFFFWICHKNI
jgi:hypothetical protein